MDFYESVVSVEHFHHDIKGQTDFSKAASILMGNFQEFFKDQLANIACRKVSKSFEQLINQILKVQEPLMALPDTPGYINYTILGQPMFGEGYMAIGFDGSFLL